jgi:large subunit ribosomal protein L15
MIADITGQAGARKRRKRVGRGESSGLGKTCGRGYKGMQSRSGSGPHPLHEGGQMPIFRRLPKRGFSNVQFATRYSAVNVGTLSECFAKGERVDLDALRKHGLVSGTEPLVKILGDGQIDKSLTVVAHSCSARARELIEKAGGKVELIARPSAAQSAKGKRNTAKASRPAGDKGGAAGKA